MIEVEQAAVDKKEGLLARMKDWWQGFSQHCQDVEKAKEACDRANLKKNGKDWVGKCCGG